MTSSHRDAQRNVFVSAIVPTTGGALLERALASVRAQEGVETETVVVLDRPERADWVRSVLNDGEQLLVTRGFQGGSVARNLGAANSSGGYIAFLDDDDTWDPFKLLRQVSCMQAVSADWSWTDSRFIRGSKVSMVPSMNIKIGQSMADYLVCRPRLRYGAGFVQSSSLVVTRARPENRRR